MNEKLFGMSVKQNIKGFIRQYGDDVWYALIKCTSRPLQLLLEMNGSHTWEPHTQVLTFCDQGQIEREQPGYLKRLF